ncbi:MAG: winged helix-turn-helix domain-containing protein [Blastocatellia bacterium]
MQPFATHYYEFGPFRVEPQERVLTRAGEPVSLTPKAFETLLVLVERHGHIVEKEELFKRVWPDSYIEDSTLAKNIWTLRKVFGGEENEQSYIETIPKRGYRFVAPVKEIVVTEPVAVLPSPALEPQANVAPSQPLPAPVIPEAVPAPVIDTPRLAAPQWWRSWPILSLVSLAMISLMGLAIWWLAFRRPSEMPASNLRAVPLTTFPGRETQAAFSPDDSQIAFVWTGPQGDNTDIYVKLVEGETPLRLTTDPASDMNPIWSPDKKSIYFLRQAAGSSAYYQVSPLGGAERKLTDVWGYRLPFSGNSPYLSPDGKYLAISDKKSTDEPLSLFLFSPETGENRQLTTPPQGTVGDYYPAFSPDGKWLAFARATSLATSDLYLLPLPNGEPRRLTRDNLTVQGVTWTADSREVVFASQRGGSIRYLWRIAATGGTPERLTEIGQDVVSPAISHQGNRLAYTKALDDLNIWHSELPANRKNNALLKPPVKLIGSSLPDSAPDYAPDGQKIVFSSNRSGGYGLWICESDGTRPRLLLDRGPYLTGTPRWSPDGRWIAFDSRSNDSETTSNPDIYLISAEGGQPQRITHDPAEDVAPSWSRDGRWLYFGSTRSGSMQIWKAPMTGGEAKQVTREGGFEGFESADGQTFYYAKGRGIPGIWQVPVGGGEERLVVDQYQAGLWRYWRVAEQGLYFATAATPTEPSLKFFSFAAQQVSEVIPLAREVDKYSPGLAISPDGRHLLCVRRDPSGSDLMMVENFR